MLKPSGALAVFSYIPLEIRFTGSRAASEVLQRRGKGGWLWVAAPMRVAGVWTCSCCGPPAGVVLCTRSAHHIHCKVTLLTHYSCRCGCSPVPIVVAASCLRCLLDSNPFFDPRRQRFVLHLFKGGRGATILLRQRAATGPGPSVPADELLA